MPKHYVIARESTTTLFYRVPAESEADALAKIQNDLNTDFYTHCADGPLGEPTVVEVENE